MAKKRMVSNQIVDSDAFLDMPLSAQALYLHLLVRADDEGFSNGFKKVMRMIRASDDDLKILVAKNFVIMFESGVLVIKHWLIHNTIRKDRLIPTVHNEEKSQIGVKTNGSYTLRNSGEFIDDRQVTDICQTGDSQVADSCQADDRIDKNRLDKNSNINNNIYNNKSINSKEKDINNKELKEKEYNNIIKKEKIKNKKEKIKHYHGEYKHVLITDEELDKLKEDFPNEYEDMIKNLDEYLEIKNVSYKNHYLVMRKWKSKEKKQNKNFNKNNNKKDVTIEWLDDVLEE